MVISIRSIKGGEFLDLLSDYNLIKNIYVPWKELFGNNDLHILKPGKAIL
jgi:hypothetical protein